MKLGFLERNSYGIQGMLWNYLLVMAVCFIVSLVAAPLLWVGNVGLTHTILELACIFVALAAFIIGWYTYPYNQPVNHMVSFGFLSVGVFDAFHTYFYLKLNLDPASYFDLSTRFWILGRLAEALILLACTLKVLHRSTKKWIGVVITMAIAGGISGLTIYFHDVLPVLLTRDGLTPLKIVLEYIIIIIFFISLYRLRKETDSKISITYRYIFLALLIAISAELCFTLYTTITSFFQTFGHILKIAYYYCLFRGIFLSAVTYPYERLKASSDYYSNLLNQIPTGILTFGRELEVGFSNRKALDIMRCSLEEIQGLTDIEIAKEYWTPADGDNEYSVRQVVRTSSNITNRLRLFKDRYGKQVKIISNCYILGDEGFLYVFNEAKMEQELENLRLQTRTILNSINNLVFMIDKDKKIIMCNKTAESIVGVREQDIVGMDIDKFNRMIQFSSMKLPHEVAAGRELSEEVSIVTADGVKKDLLLHCSPIFDIDGETMGAISIGSDITGMKKRHEQLIQQEKLALLGQMGASIVHETKNFLSTIKGSSQLLSLIAENEKVKTYARKIDNATNEVNRIISDFLSLSKPRVPVLKETSLNCIVQSVKNMLETSSLMQGVDIAFDYVEDEKPVLCDGDQVKQVILNIAKNAVEAMDGVEKSLLAVVTGFNEDSNVMFIKISDNGIGIPKEVLSKIGTPFFTTKEKGTGLGLSVCFQIIKDHGGRIDIESEQGKGTTFTICLPCVQSLVEIEAV